MAQSEEDIKTPETDRDTRIRSAGLDPRVLQKAADGDVLAIMSLGINVFELSTDAIPNTDAMQFIADAMNTAYQKNMTGEISLPDHSIETIDLSLETISYEHPHIVAGMGKIPPEVTSQPIEQPSTPTTALTRAETIEKMWAIQETEQTVPLETFEQGFTLLNPSYNDFFAAVKDTGGVFVNSLHDQLELAFNEDAETLQTFIDMADDSARINTLTEVISTEAGSTDLVLALSKANDMAPASIDPHSATPLPSVGPEIPTIDEIIVQETLKSGIETNTTTDVNTFINLGNQTDIAPNTTAPQPLQSPTMPESLPTIDTTPPSPPPQETIDTTPPIAMVNTTPEITVEFNYVTSIADANMLLNGKANDDMDFLRDVVEEAKELGVDTDLINSIETQIDANDFVTTKASVAGVNSYAQAIKDALADDGLITNDEYKGALSNFFTQISGGMVVDRAGIADDIAAAPGTANIAKQLMDEASSLAELSAPQAELVMAEAREAAKNATPATTNQSLAL